MGRMAPLAVVLGGLLVFGACTPASSSAPPAAAGRGQRQRECASASHHWEPVGSGASQQPPADDWAAIVEAARREGVVQCACPPRPDYARLIKDNFEQASPGIRFEPSPATLPDIWARVEKEQAAGQFLWDVYMFGPTVEMFALKDRGGFESFRDYMVGPDVGTESVWDGGCGRGVPRPREAVRVRLLAQRDIRPLDQSRPAAERAGQYLQRPPGPRLPRQAGLARSAQRRHRRQLADRDVPLQGARRGQTTARGPAADVRAGQRGDGRAGDSRREDRFPSAPSAKTRFCSIDRPACCIELGRPPISRTCRA